MFLAYSDSFLRQAQVSKDLIEAKAVAVEEVNLDQHLHLNQSLYLNMNLSLNFSLNVNGDGYLD